MGAPLGLSKRISKRLALRLQKFPRSRLRKTSEVLQVYNRPILIYFHYSYDLRIKKTIFRTICFRI